MKHWFKRAVYLVGVVIFAGTTFTLYKSNPNPHTRAELLTLVRQLNEAAAIGVPHDFLMQEEKRAENQNLLSKVESGQELSDDESKHYRELFQSVLLDSQIFLSRFDGQLAVMQSHAMATANNVGGQGIAGPHDHHDISARENFSVMLASLNALQTSDTFLSRIRYTNAIQKDLVDLVSHIGVAAHTVSVPYTPVEQPWPDAVLGEAFETYLETTKQAQFLPVNSARYWLAIDEALSAYVDLIAMVQARANSATSRWERRIAGRFMSVQTLAPPVDLSRQLRRK